jgi:Cation transporting ATPase, C-terminus
VEKFEDVKAGSEQFGNMFKIVGSVAGVEPCRRYSCKIGVKQVANDGACFGAAGSDLVYDGLKDKTAISKGKKCFDLWSVSQQNEVLRRAQTAYLLSVVQMQWANGIICKSRSLSVFQHGMRNMVFNAGLVWETALALAFAYVPFINSAFLTRGPRLQHLVPALPFALFIFVYDETRKGMIRHAGKGGTGVFSKLTRFVRDYSHW